jgi:hypothetical protein
MMSFGAADFGVAEGEGRPRTSKKKANQHVNWRSPT